MGREFSASNTTMVLNGHEVTGWSEAADALTMPNVDLAAITRGADGRLTTSDTGNVGGQVVIKLQPSSRSTKFFMNLVAAIRAGGRIKWNGFVRYNDTQTSVTLLFGVLVNAPLGQTVGKGAAAEQVFTFEFEQIIPDYSVSDFS